MGRRRAHRHPHPAPRPNGAPQSPRAGEGKIDWLSRALGRCGALPLREAQEAIRAGRVAIAGRVVRQPLAPVKASDRVVLDGRPVDLAAPTLVLAYHKPAGLLTARGPGGVFEALLPRLSARLARFEWHAVGRLDQDTTGLLLFTNDERLVAHATSPASHLPKSYVAQVGAEATEDKLSRIRSALPLSSGPARPALARALAPREVELVLTEGKNHQVKRMLGAVGLPVLRLHRRAIGGLELDVAVGEHRELSPSEIRDLLGYSPG